jgi:hypothetical protein
MSQVHDLVQDYYTQEPGNGKPERGGFREFGETNGSPLGYFHEQVNEPRGRLREREAEGAATIGDEPESNGEARKKI